MSEQSSGALANDWPPVVEMTETHQRAMALAVVQDPILAFTINYLKDQGFVLPRDGPVARESCEEQARLGAADAQVACGVLLSLGIFGENEPFEAEYWFRSAADQGHPAGMLMLAGWAESGSDSEKPDELGAVSLIRKAAKTDYPPALVQMAILHLNGIHVKENRSRALEYLRAAADQGDREGQFFLGSQLLEEADSRAIKEGIHWLEIAAENGSAGAHRHLGYLYFGGSKGVVRDIERSERHFLIAEKIEESVLSDFAT